MRRLLLTLVAICAMACNNAIHETEYEVRFTDGTTTSVVGYEVVRTMTYYEVKSVHNNSIFDKSKVVGVYPKEVGYIWNPINE